MEKKPKLTYTEKMKKIRMETAALKREAAVIKKETKAITKETEAIKKETKAITKETEAIKKETEAIKKETEALKKETEAIAKANEIWLKKNERKKEEGFAKLKVLMDENAARIKEISATVGGISNNNGFFSEEYFYQSFREYPSLCGIQFDEVLSNVHKINKALKTEAEFDSILINEDSVGIVEVKYRAHLKDFDKLIDKKLKAFRLLFPIYKDYKVYLALASMSTHAALQNRAEELGVALITQKGDKMLCLSKKIRAY